MLLVMIWLEAAGAMLTTESVHILWCSMVSIMRGREKHAHVVGRVRASSIPASPPGQKAESQVMSLRLARKIRG